ncbi:hypothetical protein [Lysobacter capsici]|uniref:hypothetical protein n=1 Tax=Lysobacter capsici TaxID=435897 RepID=UPI001C001572|nr:hypothetical protein [Lysobacter capsici]QWF15080.1 hypothetical protein KME82_14855 [Lysobacter capsici]
MLVLSGLALVYVFAPQSTTAPREAVTIGEPTAERSGDSDADLQRMQAQVASLQSQINAIERRGDPASQRGVASMADMRRQIAADEQRHAAYVAGLQASFQLEKVDPRWSTKTTSRLWDAINQADAMRGAARNVECRASTCRMELADDGSGRVNKSLPLWSQQLVDVLPRMVGQTVVNQNGQTQTVLYLMGPDPASSPAPKS